MEPGLSPAIRRAGLVLTALLVTLVGCGAPAPQPHHHDTVAMSGTDAEFLSAMVAGHQQTAALLRLTEGRVGDPELATLAAAITSTQADELTTMLAWLAAAHPTGASAEPSTGHQHPTPSGSAPDPGDVARLSGAPGRQLDVALANVLIARQQGADELARAELNDGAAAAVIGFAQRVSDSRTAEVAQLLSMVQRLTA